MNSCVCLSFINFREIKYPWRFSDNVDIKHSYYNVISIRPHLQNRNQVRIRSSPQDKSHLPAIIAPNKELQEPFK